ncbi:MAG: STAS domain-containing protein [Zoogloeaceae bacterium]|jgi:anti-sigma B factor antagonist/stage II sporulation protein AA (anti-sigma F factor antagonist)|nr:STAS domain-containing protein [Zoogloeaceae bacterium]
MELTAQEHAKANVAALHGRIDHAASQQFPELLRPYLEKCVKDAKPLILDFSDVEYISSAGLRTLMVAERTARNQGGVFGVAAFQPMVREVFSISRFDLLIPCFETLENALDKLGKQE